MPPQPAACLRSTAKLLCLLKLDRQVECWLVDRAGPEAASKCSTHDCYDTCCSWREQQSVVLGHARAPPECNHARAHAGHYPPALGTRHDALQVWPLIRKALCDFELAL